MDFHPNTEYVMDLQIETGAFSAIIGGSGSGKSTPIIRITGIDRPQER